MLFVMSTTPGRMRNEIKHCSITRQFLKNTGITKAQMDSSVAWYMRNFAAYTRIYEQVIKDLEKRQADEKKEKTE